ncbi:MULTISPECIES: PilX N-terminal domain-containing pilus assembly protein [unclassified Pseudomonas]|uniref:PilX N-terminal domain-containing pilus assembly protein n=1 Tax=unclassified Pseudomonas TaxID=196821 RepID=UPI002A3651CF|nr:MULTISPECIES: PilX N-terminal domain-containing pilus assembly protein [unclassified Pseudomonas]MDX9669577.1 general secretion pathway protein GspK [Pseudomonas sp. P8_250]WPN36387.1 general secretion pathway protein GspK [Pseudomonas sp. P8_139]WPN41812.1 general secretion pathway protein GspK [Pseudomonas sp. P8_229]
MRTQRGAALIVALWALALLSLIVGTAVQTTRLENRQSAYELHHLEAQLAAEAGFAMALKDLSSSKSVMIADGRPYPFFFEDTQLTLRVYSERGKLDLNFCSIESLTLLASFFGASPNQTQQMAQELSKRRANLSTIKAIEELQQFPEMDSRLYVQMEPFLTLWSGLVQPDTSFALAPVRAALKLEIPVSRGNPGSVLSAKIYAIHTTGTTADLNVTFLLNSQGDNAQLYRVLRWQE